MLNGLAPLLILDFQYSVAAPPTRGLGNLFDPALKWTQGALGAIPMPIYLDENVTGIVIDGETTALDVETDITPLQNGGTLVKQKGVSNICTINMKGPSDNVFVSVLTALMDQIIGKTVSQDYKISYFNGPTVIFRGLIHSWNSSISDSDNLIRMQLQIQKPASLTPVAAALGVTVPKITGVTP